MDFGRLGLSLFRGPVNPLFDLGFRPWARVQVSGFRVLWVKS